MLAQGIAYAGTVVAFAMCFAIGSNDVCQSLVVGSGAVSVRRAVYTGAIFEFLGVVLMGGAVSNTIREGFIDLSFYKGTDVYFSLGMFASLLAAAVWLFVSTYYKLPVSTTHSVVGGLLGFTLTTVGSAAVRFGFFGNVAVSWVASPLMGAGVSYIMFSVVQRTVFAQKRDVARRARQMIPWYNGWTCFVMMLFIVYKGLPNVGVEVPLGRAVALSAMAGAAVVLATRQGWIPTAAQTALPGPGPTAASEDDAATAAAEAVFVPLLVLTGLLVAFAHGSNDVSNGVGCLLVMMEVSTYGYLPTRSQGIPQWVMVMGGLGIAGGLILLGHRVMNTMGSRITLLTPSRGYCAQLATSTTVLLATAMGVPVSSTHTMVGAVTGIALVPVDGVRGAINLATIKKIVVSWVITLPAGAITTIVIFVIARGVFYDPSVEVTS